jgi:branched-chain amino acid transport system ATP-binding protein
VSGAANVLELRGIAHDFSGLQVLSGIDLDVREAERHAIIGPNGAGKSTLFNILTGRYTPRAGHVLYRGRDITGASPHRIARLGIGRSFQIINIFPRLTVFENVQAAYISHRGRGRDLFRRVERLYAEETEAVLASLGLLERATEVSGFLSHGAQKQLELGIALASEPRLLLLDEPTAGMSATETRETIRLVDRIARERGLTLLFTEHDMAVVFSIAQKITVLHQGRVIADGAPAEVRANPEVRRVYMGERK